MGETDLGREIWFWEIFYGLTWEKKTPSVPKFVYLSPIVYKTLKTQNSQSWECRKNKKMGIKDPNHWMSIKSLPIHGKNEYHCKNVHGECPGAPKTWGRQNHGCMREWVAKMGIYLAHKSKHVFPKIGALPNSNIDLHTLPIPCNN